MSASSVPTGADSLSPRELAAAAHPLPAWLLSGMLHFAFVISLALLFRAGALTGSGQGIEGRGGEIVLYTSDSTAEEPNYLTEEQAASAESETTTGAESAAMAGALPSDDAAPALPGVGLPNAVTGRGSPQATATAASAAGTIGKLGPRGGKGGSAATAVFGALGEGQRFMYVFDRSSSMSGAAMKAAKQELLLSLTHLGDIHQFGIVFYNHTQSSFGDSSGSAARMYFAKRENRILAEKYVSSIGAQGSTNHLPALKLALDARPDVIFFLTDADDPVLTAAELQKIRGWNVGATINAIQFGYGPKQSFDTFLEILTSENGGMYRYVDVTQLPRGK